MTERLSDEEFADLLFRKFVSRFYYGNPPPDEVLAAMMPPVGYGVEPVEQEGGNC